VAPAPFGTLITIGRLSRQGALHGAGREKTCILTRFFLYYIIHMTTIVVIIHVIVSLALICIVLLQHGKGAGIGAAFGGSSQTVFGSTGAAPFLAKLTAAVAILFMCTSLGLTFLGRQQAPSVMQGTGKPAATHPAPAAPAKPAPAAPATK
jgi:preprotein translocase subunit SecG